MNETGGPEDRRDRGQRQQELVARLIDGDGDSADDVAAELADLLRASPADRESLSNSSSSTRFFVTSWARSHSRPWSTSWPTASRAPRLAPPGLRCLRPAMARVARS
ncbi:MAG: hypothetical protein ACKO35_14585 [Planctomycetaceae bacterium]